MAVLLENPVRSYAWGSATVIPDLLGLDPTGDPQAELWVGAHPGSPSVVAGDGRTLDQYIAADPAGALGPGVLDRFGAALPYLLKILAIERPLSIQAHPTIAQAAEGFDAEDAAGTPLGSPKRSYQDRNHKPEMVVALTEFEALLGFRDPAEVAAALELSGREEFTQAIAMLRQGDGLRRLVTAWLSLPESEAVRIARTLADEARAHSSHEPFAVVDQLAATYPDDRGLLLALLMRRIRLNPGEAAFVAAGVPHAYLSGFAVEPQASSDNTLRAGLTPKHVDAAEVLRILRYEPDGGMLIVPQDTQAGEQVYPVPGLDEFRLARLQLDAEEIRPSGSGPRVVLVVDGAVAVRAGSAQDAGDSLQLRSGQAAFVPASEPDVVVSGTGTAFTVTPG
ncbi:mannose-6-phosphate isomerase, class I [Phytoactinopolyspora mesophila]|uniref:mannose-6-phosphate isomerase n=1 Tax=Phytoactinopolyspora mesophila TaxID=2650750 RepID=A0A7K3M9D7_9ACTN|nr:mannose-6-phosphate isomerase, class I [Phytoactinopolyspora mesophila]